MRQTYRQDARITTACILAAGTGSRLQPLTDCMPKCLTEVNGQPILGRLVSCLRQFGFKRLVLVVGHLENCIRDFLEVHASDFVIDYVQNPAYETTNNIYSLWLARDDLKEPSLLIESDLVFDSSLLSQLLYPDRIAVSNLLPWMNGTTITMNSSRRVSRFCLPRDPETGGLRYKTVNIYSLSKSSWSAVFTRLEQYISAGRVDEYYEAVFREMISEGSLNFECVLFEENRWYEIDTLEDLRGAQKVFAQTDPIKSDPINSIAPPTRGFQRGGYRSQRRPEQVP